MRKPDYYAKKHYNVARENSVLNDTNRSVFHFLYVIEYAPNTYRAYQHLGDIFLENKRETAALAYYQKGVEVRPDDYDLRYSLSLLLGNMGKYDQAITHLNHLLSLQADNEELKSLLKTLIDRQKKK